MIEMSSSLVAVDVICIYAVDKTVWEMNAIVIAQLIHTFVPRLDILCCMRR